MIREEIEKRVETTVVDALEQEAKHTNPEINPPVEEKLRQQQIEASGRGEEDPLLNLAEPEQQDVPDPEPVQVAGIGSIIRNVGEAVGRRVEEAETRVRMETAEPTPVREVGDTLMISPADPDDVKQINEQLGGEYTSGLNIPNILESSGEFDAAQYVSQFKDANQELFEQARRGTISFDQMLEMAQERGLDNIVYDLTRRDPGEVMPPEDFLAGMLAYSQLMKQTRTAWTEAFNMPQGPEREAALRRALEIATVHSQVAANLSGVTSEAARTLQTAGELGRRGLPSVSEEVALFGAKTAEEINYVGRYYMMITDPSKMARFLKRGLVSRSLDVMSEVWVNSILTSPVTHAINISGNSMYQGMRTLETFIAAGFGRARSAITGNQSRVRASDGLARLEGIRRAMLDGVIMAGKTFVNETPSDLSSKIDTGTRRAIGTTGDPREILRMIRNGETGPAAINALGSMYRLGGRALMAEDEFFKAIAGRAELYEIANQRASEMYRSTIASGGTVEEAQQAAAVERANVINDPPENVRQQVTDHAKLLTFQQDVDGFLGNFQGAMSHPIAKLFVPFFRTPVNIMGATLSRTPLAVVSRKIRNQLRAGGREADLAMARIAMGSSIMAGFSYAAFDFDGTGDMVIVGKGPSDPEARQAMMRQGFQPYSINIKQEDGTYQSITYSRFDPVSGLLAMAADMAYYAQYETDQATLDALAASAVAGVAEYMTEMPLLQGVSELQSVLLERNSNDRLRKLREILAEKSTTAALAFTPGNSAFTANVARIEDPIARNVMLPEEGVLGEDPTQLPAFMRGFYTALQRAKSRNPLFNQDLPPRLNEWGEEIKVGNGYAWEFISPIRIRDTKYSAIDEELQRLGDGFTRTPRKIDGVLLNAEQYNRWITLTNTIDQFGRLPDDPRYDSSSTLLLDMERLIMTPEYQELPTRDDQARVIKNLMSERRSAARQYLLQEDARLRGKVNSVQ